MEHEYSWASNKTKLQQSLAKVNAEVTAGERAEFSEEAVKEEYIRRGGLLLSDNGSSLAAKLPEEAAQTVEEKSEKTEKTEKPKTKKK